MGKTNIDLNQIANNISNKYKSYLKKYMTTYITSAAYKAEDLIVKRSKYAINKYYTYDPSYYVRTNLMSSENKIFKPYHSKVSTSQYYMVVQGGIKLNSGYLSPAYKTKGISMSSIYYQSIYKGQHGVEKLTGYNGTITDKYGGHQYSWKDWRPIIIPPSPYDYINKYIETSTELRNECIKAGFKAANKIPKP